MMVRDDRLYAFIVARTTRSRARIRRISVDRRWMKVFVGFSAVVLCAALYGFYGLTQHFMHLRIERENAQLRAENEKQRQQLNHLNQRVEAVEESSRRLAEISGVEPEQQPQANTPGAGGPEFSLDEATALEYKTVHLEQELRDYEMALRERATVPSLWPVAGTLESGFGGRRNPFGGSSLEFHSGQDIEAPSGTPIAAAASGTVTYAGWMNGYGNLVIVDHGGGLTTRYGHQSRIEVKVGQSVTRGQLLGLVGSTGRSTGPHLHYEVRINDHPVDPRQYLPGVGN
jgi:murein DD-endopeptidase MepM/ murein hydrolase activator NlpD